ncbi:hypothetical protein [Gorillibacterium timonense]|uniref:hypothetical protein n=1 Tax=Gorillibacterium timonense TaxID=1689269 RepID=UPI00071E316F|nr:hypothetical protein [Gorillibacterium timonense]
MHSNGTLGYWVNYRNSLVEGFCYFVPYNGRTIGFMKNYSVETDQEKVINITSSVIENYSIYYNAELDTYEAIGNISFISDDEEIIVVSVQDLELSISNEEYDISNIRINDWVKIEIKGLIFWDEGIY